MSPTYDVIPHRLIPGVSGVPADAVNLSVNNNNAGGFGTAEFDTFAAPTLAKGDAVAIDLEGRAFEGKVSEITSGIGEKLTYHVSCLGRFDDHKTNETVEGVFVDRDLAQWQVTDCNNWGVAPDFQINVDTSAGLHFAWPEVDKLMCYQSETGTYYKHVGNGLPHFDDSDFPAPDKLWSAAYYYLPGEKLITGLSFEATDAMYWGPMLAKTTPDYTNPIGPPDERYGHRFSRYPKINYWSDFYNLGSWAFDNNTFFVPKCPVNAFVGVYVCDQIGDLPVGDPVAMWHDPRSLHLFYPGIENDPVLLKIRTACSGHLILFYAAYLPVRLPHNLSHQYSKNADHLVRTDWVARNRIYATHAAPTGAQTVDIQNVSVYSQGYESEPDGSDDLANVFRIIFPTCICESMPLPAPFDDSAPTSIVLRSRTTEAAAVPELLGLYPVEMSWGWWEDDVLVITSDAGTVAVIDEPGVDTRGAKLSDEGAVDLVLVAYSPTAAIPQPGDLLIPETAYLTVDKDGAYTVVAAGWAPEAGQRVAYIDATGAASSEIAAARIGQMTAIDRRPAQWTGSVSLKGIDGASLFRPGQLLTAPGIGGALITSTTVDVDGDAVSLALGNTGYRGRFPARVPGKPLTASPNNPDHGRDRPLNRRRSGGGRR